MNKGFSALYRLVLNLVINLLILPLVRLQLNYQRSMLRLRSATILRLRSASVLMEVGSTFVHSPLLCWLNARFSLLQIITYLRVMVIERKNNEVIIRFTSSISTKRIQELVDYLRYTELAEKSKATKKDLELLVAEVKKKRTLKKAKS